MKNEQLFQQGCLTANLWVNAVVRLIGPQTQLTITLRADRWTSPES
jgi:hypothetical protein